MFTGIIKDIGIIKQSIGEAKNPLRLVVFTKLPVSYLDLGASLSCNGVCLTIVERVSGIDGFDVHMDVGPETLARTNLSQLKKGLGLNLEPALRHGDSFGGHYVTGHVDEVGIVADFTQKNSGFFNLAIKCSKHFSTLLLPQGSIAIRGVSLTIVDVEIQNEECLFRVMLIPHTLQLTNLSNLSVGESVELEYDCNIKAIVATVEKLLPQLVKRLSS